MVGTLVTVVHIVVSVVSVGSVVSVAHMVVTVVSVAQFVKEEGEKYPPIIFFLDVEVGYLFL